MSEHKQDRVFDGLAKRFQRQIYDDPRGMIRLAILQDDLAEWVQASTRPLRILDAGGGLGQMALWLAQHGHHVTLVEPALEMLTQAQTAITEAHLDHSITSVHATIQDYLATAPQPFDAVICHAVLEWLAEPHAVLAQLAQILVPNGWLSVMFFNQHSTVMRRLIAGDLTTVRNGVFESDGKRGLAPISLLTPDEVLSWLPEMQLELLKWSGVRSFYDYMYRDVRKTAPMEDVLPLEREYSTREPWRSLARYQHFLCRFNAESGMAQMHN